MSLLMSVKLTEKAKKLVTVVSFFIIGSLITMIFAVGAGGGVAFGQNVTANETSKGGAKFGSFVIPGKGQNAIGNETSVDTTQPGPDNGSSSLLSNLVIDHAGGGFTSLQVDGSNKTWITTGNWDLVSNPSSTSKPEDSATFNATIVSRGTDNSDEHEHKISEFKLMNRSINSSSEGTTIVLNGTGSVETDVGLYSDVPISIRITDKAPAIISLDTQTNVMQPQWFPDGGTVGVLIDERVQDHFGDTPIYGNIKKEK
jgi:hypothetical protein